MDYGLYNANGVIGGKLRAAGFKTVTFGSPSDANLNANSIMPIAHMTLDSSTNGIATQQYNYRVLVADLPDTNNISPRDVANALTLSDNKEDILHDLAERVNVVKKSLAKDLDVVESSEELTLSVVMSETKDGLIGYTFELSITIESAGIC